MKMLTKVALVSAMAISANAMAMESLDDSALSAATGQDGITIGVELGQTGISIGNVYLHDNDGLDSTLPNLKGSDTAGAIAINGLTIKQNTAGNLATLDIDADGDTNGAFLNVAAEIAGLDLDIDTISVGASGTLNEDTAMRGTTAGSEKEIISGLSLSLGKIGANIQLGSTPQGAMIKLNSTLTGGLTITDLGINDAANGGSIVMDKIFVRGAGNTSGDLLLDADVNITPTGLQVKNNGTQGINNYVQGIHLGAASNASVGDLEIQNLNLAGSTITITGH